MSTQSGPQPLKSQIRSCKTIHGIYMPSTGFWGASGPMDFLGPVVPDPRHHKYAFLGILLMVYRLFSYTSDYYALLQTITDYSGFLQTTSGYCADYL